MRDGKGVLQGAIRTDVRYTYHFLRDEGTHCRKILYNAASKFNT
jgi:hypothetical protein